MPKFHVELDSRIVETCVFEIEARDLEEAIEKAMSRQDCEPIEIKTFPGDNEEADYDNSFEMTKPPS